MPHFPFKTTVLDPERHTALDVEVHTASDGTSSIKLDISRMRDFNIELSQSGVAILQTVLDQVVKYAAEVKR